MEYAEVGVVIVVPGTPCSGCKMSADYRPWYRLQLMVRISNETEDQKFVPIRIFFCPSCALALGLRETRVIYDAGDGGLSEERAAAQTRWLIEGALRQVAEEYAARTEDYYQRTLPAGEWTEISRYDFLAAAAAVGLIAGPNPRLADIAGFVDGSLEWKMIRRPAAENCQEATAAPARKQRKRK